MCNTCRITNDKSGVASQAEHGRGPSSLFHAIREIGKSSRPLVGIPSIYVYNLDVSFPTFPSNCIPGTQFQWMRVRLVLVEMKPLGLGIFPK
jgi:hypothetical protein